MNPEMLDMFPPPPPWRKEKDEASDEVVYINEVTGEKTDIHPLQIHFDKKKSNAQDQEEEASTALSGNTSNDFADSRSEFGEDKVEEFCGGEHLDFRCEWKELGLMGNILSYGITLKYFLEDKHFELAFDGVDAVWKYSKIDGIYGPVDEYDLFIGSKIVFFGRHLSISSTNSDICRMIDNVEKKLKKKRAYLQDKIEMVGAIPIVKRATQDRIRNITRSTSKTGHGNLRQLRNECLKLSEQMGEVGLTHLIK
jgi:hypothetical protein